MGKNDQSHKNSQSDSCGKVFLRAGFQVKHLFFEMLNFEVVAQVNLSEKARKSSIKNKKLKALVTRT